MSSTAVAEFVRRWFAPCREGPGVSWPRWLFLRALGLVFLSAFLSLAFQIEGLMGPRGILPAGEYLDAVARQMGGPGKLWYAPTLLWLSTGTGALWALVIGGLVASSLLTANLWPRLAAVGCTVLFLSFVAATEEFSRYQSDGMLIEAGFVAAFFAPGGRRPGLAAGHPASRASHLLLRWEWFRIYFESGLVKILSGEPQWRDLTAMDRYHENGPLPTWIGWWAQQMPQGLHAATVVVVLVVELGVVWMAFLPRRSLRRACFVIVSLLQVGIIATANYAFLNYLVLALGILLLDDVDLAWIKRRVLRPAGAGPPAEAEASPGAPTRRALWVAALVLCWFFYASVLVAPLPPLRSLPAAFLWPAVALQPLRLANRYGLFAVMTRERIEIELQGSRDGSTWVAWRFRHKPQDPAEPPRIFAPYQPRFDWNLWFASLGTWRESQWVLRAQARLLEGEPSVRALFRDDPFATSPPVLVRSVRWKYRFTSLDERRRTGRWWHREPAGPFGPTLERQPDGRILAAKEQPEGLD